MIRLQAEAASTFYSPPLPPPFILSTTRSDAPSSGTLLLLPIPVSTSSPSLQLPSASRREDIPEVTLPPRKRLGIALGLGYEVGESSSATAARPAGGLRVDYSFVATMDRKIMHDLEREKQMSPKRTTRSTADQETINATSITNAQLQVMIDQGVTAALAARDTLRSVRRTERATRECTYTDFPKCQPLPFKGIEGVASLSQWCERIESVFHINNCAVENQVKFATWTLHSIALTWWNTHVKTVGHEADYDMP
nr:hypothetical protein [Tanacetum cinerariifolium]